MSLVEATGYQRILRSTAATLSMSVYDGSEVGDPGDTTVTVTRADGTTLKDAGTATSGTGGMRTVALTASETADLDQLTCVWETTNSGMVTTYAEIVGSRLFSLNEARNFQTTKYQNLADQQLITDDDLDAARSRIEDEFANICGTSFISRYTYEIHDHPCHCPLMLRQSAALTLRSLDYRLLGEMDFTALDDDELALLSINRTGTLCYEYGVPTFAFARQIRIGYVYGRLQVPLQIKQAALRLLAYASSPSNLPDRALSLSDEIGTFRLATPGMRGSWFGLPEVDAVLARFQNRTRGFA